MKLLIDTNVVLSVTEKDTCRRLGNEREEIETMENLCYDNLEERGRE